MLLKIPVELVEDILEHIDCPSDLAALSAVCKGLKQIVSPAPGAKLGALQCCYLSVTLDNSPVFNLLASWPRLARAVRRLRILDKTVHLQEYDQPTHDHYWNEHKEGQAQDDGGEINPLLVHAVLVAMENLEFFCFQETPLSPTLDWSFLFGNLIDLCSRLRAVHLALWNAGGKNIGDDFTFPRVGEMAKLESLRLRLTDRAFFLPTAFRAYINSTMKTLCSTLRCLFLECDTGMLLDFFEFRFPSLQSLSLSAWGQDLGAIAEPALPTFLTNHPTILALYLTGFHAGPIARDCLPGLQEFRGGDSWRELAAPLSDGTHRPLRWFDVTLLQLWIHDPNGPDFIRDIARSLGNLHALEGLFVEAFTESPSMSRTLLGLGSGLANVRAFSCGSPSGRQNHDQKGLIFLAMCFPNLRYIKDYFLASTSHADIEALLRNLDGTCDKLVCIDNWVRDDNRPWE